jgi:hypothetical protein
MIDTSLQSHEKFESIKDMLPGYKWIQKLLIVGLATKFPSDKWISKLKKFTSTSHKKLTGPIVIVAGACDAEIEQQMKDYQKFLIDACKDFKGTIISGGTTAGISGLIGEVGQKYPDTVRTIGYLPKKIPSDVSIDRRYSETRYTDGDVFSPLEPLQYWIDILASGIPPAQIKLLGINGGVIAALEYKIALSLGAYVALVENSGREAAKLLKDDDWCTSKMLIQIPKDAKTIMTYFGFGKTKISSRIIETIAQEIHENYRHIRARSLNIKDPSMADWSKLSKELKESNRQQANNIFNMLGQIGCTVHKVTKRPVSLMTFSKNEIETMAKIEHARWNIERFLDGWTWAKERDVIKKTSPFLVSWSDVPDEIKELDRETVRKIPEFLAKVGLEIHRLTL